jgi:gamma-glutamylaminecyclotransferase
MHQVFVYGTLKRGCCNHHYLKGHRFLGDASTQPEYAMYDLGGYPGMVEDFSQPISIEGEVWEVDDACLKQLDELEDVATGEYARVPMRLKLPWDEAGVCGYVYRWPIQDRVRIGSVWQEERPSSSVPLPLARAGEQQRSH